MSIRTRKENAFKWLWTRWTWLSVPDRPRVGVLWQTDWSTGSSNGSDGSRKRKYPVSGSCAEGNLSSISDSLEAMGRRQRRKQPLEVCRTLSLNRQHLQPKGSVDIHSAATLLGTRRCWVRGHRAFQQLGPFFSNYPRMPQMLSDDKLQSRLPLLCAAVSWKDPPMPVLVSWCPVRSS